MNKPLLRKIAKYLLANPNKYDQDEACGSKCCIGGKAIYLTDKKVYNRINKKLNTQNSYNRIGIEENDPRYTDAHSLFEYYSRKYLKLTQVQYNTLCGTYDGWPELWSGLYAEARKDKERAQVGHDRIMHFIKTGK